MSLDYENAVKAIKKLKSLNLELANYEEVRQMVTPLVRAGFMAAYFPDYHLPIYRARPVDPQNVYHLVSQMTYPPKTTGLTFNRLSSNKHQIFYGAMMPQITRVDQITSMIEVGSLVDSAVDGDGEEYIQICKWQVRKGFQVALLGLHSSLVSNSADALKMKTIHGDLTKELDEKGRAIELVGEFMSAEFSKKVAKGREWEYKISAAYGDALFDAGIEAIQFPSVKAEGKAFNIAIHKNVVDERMAIEVGAITRIRKRGKSIIVDWFLQSPTISDGKFRWEEPPPSAVTSPYAMRLIEEDIKRNGRLTLT